MKTNFSIEKKTYCKKNIQKKKKKTTPQYFCVAENCMSEGGVLYGFTDLVELHWQVGGLEVQRNQLAA